MKRKYLADLATQSKIDTLEKNAESMVTRIGSYYSELQHYQKLRFDKIVRDIAHKFRVYVKANPLEYILIRQIALNTIRIDEAERALILGKEPQYTSAVEKWLFSAQKERREAIQTLFTLFKTDETKKKLSNFDALRDTLRTEVDLPPSENKINPDGHDRRFSK